MSGKLSILSLSVFGFSIWVKLNLLWKSCLFFPPWFCLSRKEFLLKMIFSECGWNRYHPLFWGFIYVYLDVHFPYWGNCSYEKGFYFIKPFTDWIWSQWSWLKKKVTCLCECLGVPLYKEIKCCDFTFVLKTCNNCYVSNIHSMLKGQ